MRWSVVRLIAVREIRDQLRDRRTMFLILGLPVLMYPLFVGVGILFVVDAEGEEARRRRGRGGAPAAARRGPAPHRVPAAPPRAQLVAARFPRCSSTAKFPDRYAVEPTPTARRSVVEALDAEDESLLAARQVDAILVVDPDLAGEARARRAAGGARPRAATARRTRSSPSAASRACCGTGPTT